MVQHQIITVRLWSSVSQIVLWNLYETKADDKIKWDMTKKTTTKKQKKTKTKENTRRNLKKKLGFFCLFFHENILMSVLIKMPLICNE